MSSCPLKCPVCGEPMHRVKVLPRQLSRLTRYICASGHLKDLRDNPTPTAQRAELPALERLEAFS